MMVRVRFAPSPTGYLHIGGLRTALYNYLYAKQNNGKLILRIEDTDRSRLVDGAVQNLISTLEWSGINFDEGPHIGGDFGSYVQSERLETYQEYTLKLIQEGNAYPCFYPEERVNTIKEKNIPSDVLTDYDLRFRDLKISESLDRMCTENHVVRLKVPSKGNISINDEIRGDINFDLSLIQDQIIIKSDGYPTYHLASVIDDHLMQISHVIRGEEWIASLPKHALLYKSFEWDIPTFSHLPLLLNKDKSKLSKRQGDVAVEDYINNGYTKEALINYVSLLGWHGPDNREIYNIDELIDNFEINRIKSSGAVFDVKKLIWFNQHYIKTSDPDKLQALVENTLSNDWEIKLPMLNLVKDSVDNILDFERELTPFFIYKPLEINDDDTLFSNEVYQFLHLLLNELIDIPTIKVDDFKTLVNRIKNEAQFSGNIWKPIRISVTGKTNGPDISKFIEIIGSSQCYDRIKSFLELNEN